MGNLGGAAAWGHLGLRDLGGAAAGCGRGGAVGIGLAGLGLAVSGSTLRVAVRLLIAVRGGLWTTVVSLSILGSAVHILWITTRSGACALWISRWIPAALLVRSLWITAAGLPSPLLPVPHPLARRAGRRTRGISGFGPVV
ncbi:hypothetical protein Cme02nite_26840 [Catellatospora methionotrophica]|uniref:Uncharacterized protein n=1 Tax=Catellatospora methionotrophica TaxID=121620 RepID=A0A8J3L4M1_9ACTN|nr:hypothetical protein Cme02nite_26840 [Catellatospora methionotrophica]